jgi:hypothetical protein
MVDPTSYFADQNPPICGLDVAKSFNQLRYTRTSSSDAFLNLTNPSVQMRRNMRIFWVSHLGQALESFRSSGQEMPVVSLTI